MGGSWSVGLPMHAIDRMGMGSFGDSESPFFLGRQGGDRWSFDWRRLLGTFRVQLITGDRIAMADEHRLSPAWP
jgi:hypothetical protein